MRKTGVILTAFLFTILVSEIFAQDYIEKQLRSYRNPDELVTLSAEVKFQQAIELLSKVSESTTGKKIVSATTVDSPIGIEIENMPYDKVLYIVAQMKGLIVEEKEDVIIVKGTGEDKIPEEEKEFYASVDEREVKISALFFELDVNESRERGIDWKMILSNQGANLGIVSGVDPELRQQQEGGGGGGGGTGGQQTTQLVPNFNVTGSTEFSAGGFFGQATAMFRMFEEENLGEILASPNIVTRDRKQGRIQVGADFSIKQRDFAGNIIENFYPTGVIIEVTPYIYKEDGVDYMLLDILVERSSFQQTETTTEIRKSTAKTQVVLLDGEEVALGGLFVNEQTKIRNGVPFLKDLPWWVFGLRYIFGSDELVTRKRELVVLIKAELVPTLKERLAGVKKENVLEKELLKQREKMKYYQLHETNETIKNEE